MKVKLTHKFGTETMNLKTFFEDNAIENQNFIISELKDGREVYVKTFLGQTLISNN